MSDRERSPLDDWEDPDPERPGARASRRMRQALVLAAVAAVALVCGAVLLARTLGR